MWSSSPPDKWVNYGGNPNADSSGGHRIRNKEFFTLCQVSDGGYPAVSSMMIDPVMGAMGGTGLLGSLSPAGLTTERSLSVGDYVNDPESSISSDNLFPQFTAPKTGVFNLLLCSFQSGI